MTRLVRLVNYLPDLEEALLVVPHREGGLHWVHQTVQLVLVQQGLGHDLDGGGHLGSNCT